MIFAVCVCVSAHTRVCVWFASYNVFYCDGVRTSVNRIEPVFRYVSVPLDFFFSHFDIISQRLAKRTESIWATNEQTNGNGITCTRSTLAHRTWARWHRLASTLAHSRTAHWIDKRHSSKFSSVVVVVVAVKHFDHLINRIDRTPYVRLMPEVVCCSYK